MPSFNPSRRRAAAIASLWTAAAAVGHGAEMAADVREFFESEVRPVLAEACYRCHSAGAEKLKGGLLLDHGTTALAGGDAGPVIVPGDPDASLLIEAVRYTDPDVQMPPKKRLDPEQVAALEKWVALGAPWPDEPVPTGEKKLGPKHFDLEARKAEHWCWQPVADAPPPPVRDGSWSADPIDRHVLAKLEAAGIAPSPRADRRTLIRRAHFDLVGLPPDPESVEAFVADPAPDREAFAKVVDRLLASPHFGERWARHWMDLTRYAETCGHEFDYPIPHAPAYRDYLIRAFNADVPYDQLVREHVAGDLLEEPRRNPEAGFDESVIGTGFWHFHEATHAPTDVREDEAGRVDNQIDVFSKTFLGLTVSCARCHDHMFDAISAKDYYALAGYLQSSRRQEAFIDPGGRVARAVQELEAVKALADAALAGGGYTSAPDALAGALLAARDVVRGAKPAEAAREHRVRQPEVERWADELRAPASREPEHPLFAFAQFVEGDAEPAAEAFDRRLAAVRERLAAHRRKAEEGRERATLLGDFAAGGYRESGWSTTGEAFGGAPSAAGEWSAAEGRAAVPGRAHGGRLAGKLHGVLRSPTFEITADQIHILASARKGGLQVRLIIDSYWMEVYNGLLFRGTRINDADTGGELGWLSLGGDLKMYRGHRAHLEFIDHGPGHFEIDGVWIGERPVRAPSAVAERVAALGEVRSVRELAFAYGWLAKRMAEGKGDLPGGDADRFAALIADMRRGGADGEAELSAANAKLAEIGSGVPAPQRVQALADGSGEDEYVFLRGSHSRRGDVVPRRFLTALGGESVPAPERGSGRLSLARQVADPGNPLTARVMVNRLWHHLFGRGIVPTTDDFGVLGQRPSHPELLDHLAHTLVADGWSVKRALRRMMLSETYMQSSAAVGEAEERDPNNVLLHRANLRRLQAEAIRDAMLAVSGRLDRTLFGAPVKVHLTEFMTGRGRPGSGPLDGAGRRSLYTEVRRNFLPPMMLAFDSPIPFSSMGRRSVSNVPAQALILMNDPFVHEQAGVWAKRIAGLELAPEQVVERMYLEAFARPPSAEEAVAGREFLGGAADETALREFAHVLFNAKEFVFLD